jgi:predicted permease
MRATLLGAEVGLTVVLLVAAGLLLKSYKRLRSSDLGCTTDNVLTMRLDLFGKRYNQPAQLINFYRALLQRVRALPGVEAAGFTRAVPGAGYWGDNEFTVVEHPPLPQGQMQFAINRESDPGFFAAMGIPFLRGQTFDPNRQLKDANQTVINESFAKQYFPGEDPIGKHLREDGKNWEICGIVGDTRYAQPELPKPIQYYPLYAGDLNNGTLIIRAHANVEEFAMPVQKILSELDPELPVSNVITMDQMLGKSAVNESFNTTILTAFAALSLLLAAAGLFGVLSYIVAQRTGEIGIRMALGAQRAQVLQRTLLDGMKPAVFGLVAGLAASAVLVRSIQSMLYKTEPLDPSVFVGVGALLLVVSVAACLLPAWRASRLDPMQALRTE